MAAKPRKLTKSSASPWLNHRDSTGSILIIALWSLCLLTIFAVYLGYAVRQKIVLLERLDSRGNLHFIAEAGVGRAITELKREESSDSDALKENWSNNPAVFRDVPVGYGRFSVCYNYLDYQTGLEEIRYGLVDEDRKINVNISEPEVMERLFTMVMDLDETEAQSLAASIVDWRDSDSQLSLPLGSAEDSYYRNLPCPYEAKDAEFEIFDELLLVKGMTPQILDKLRNYITIYGDSKININTAPREVLLALGLSNSLVDKILSFRCGQDSLEATADDNVFDSLSNIVAQVDQFAALAPGESDSLNNLASSGKIKTYSNNFMIKSLAQLDKKRSLEVVCVVNRLGEILFWREG